MLELGIALAQLGRDRVFLLVPRSTVPVRLPTDLDGVVHLQWNASRVDENVIAAMGAACLQIRRAIRRIGPVTEHRADVRPYFLVADDDLTPESTLVQHLQEEIGDVAQVRVVSSASEACGLLRLGGVVACLTDIVFRTDSEMAGLRVAEAARVAGVPVRVMTGHRRGNIGLALVEDGARRRQRSLMPDRWLRDLLQVELDGVRAIESFGRRCDKEARRAGHGVL